MGEPATWPASVRTADTDQHLELVQGDPLGEGGEGAVFRTRHGSLAVKVCSAVDESPARLTERLRRLQWLPLEAVPICRPLEQLAAPDVGYVMELLQDMVALRTICTPANDDPAVWYAMGGGLRRRLLLLARCASVVAILHDRGIVYSDISPGNVMISADVAHHELWLVDADNLQTESSAAGRRVGTPYYTAPELLRGTSGNTVYSDLFSFAVMAYETLTTNHPMIGEYVDEGPPELENDAQRGLVPWIDHRTDDRNRTRYGFSADQVLTRRLRNLFAQAFEEGMDAPRSRPGAGEWADALFSAADRCVTCPTCSHDYYVARNNCPWCTTIRPPVLAVEVFEQFPRVGDDPAAVLDDQDLTLLIQAGRPLVVTERTVIRHGSTPDRVLAQLDWNGGGTVSVRNRGSAAIRRVPPTGRAGRTLVPGGSADELLSAPWVLHFGSERQPHRMLAIRPPEVRGVR